MRRPPDKDAADLFGEAVRARLGEPSMARWWYWRAQQKKDAA